MSPIPCAHCGINFMRHNLSEDASKLCNSCVLREKRNNPPKAKIMNDDVDILLKCPKSIYKEIEEHIMNEGLSFTQYFLGLHLSKPIDNSLKEIPSDPIPEAIKQPVEKKKGHKK